MTEFKFLDYDGKSLFTNCLVYQNEKKVQIHLLPVIHIGNTPYYSELQNYIQDRICLFEKLNLITSDVDLKKSVSSLDDYLELSAQGIEEFWDRYKKLLKKYYKKFLTGDIKSLWKMVKKEFKNVNDESRTIYDNCVKSGFGIQNLCPIQLYLCKIMNLDHQMIAIDYVNDIPQRTNWIHTDLDLAKITENVNLNDLMEEILIDPSPEILEVTLQQIRFVLLNILVMRRFKKSPEASKRRELLADDLIQGLTQEFKEVIKNTPDYLIDNRNSLVEDKILNLIRDHEEIVVFYGLAHMRALEGFLLKQGFNLISKQSFKVFKIED